jgi:methyl-accepting chemotaxis protein
MSNSKAISASSSPFEVISTPGFWRHNYGFFITLAVCGLAGMIMSPYMLDGRQGIWIILSILAMLIGIYGVYRTFYEVLKIQIENSLISSIQEKAAEYIRRNKPVELDELRNEISPPNDTEPTPAMIRLIEQVVSEAKISRFDSSIALLQPYREEAMDIIFKLQNYQKIVLWIGIGGTFIGILDAIKPKNLEGLLGKSIGEFGNILTLMFNSLSISFSASLAGLVAATVLGCFILLVKKKQEVYFKNMESVATLVLTAARKSKNKDKYLNEIETLREDINSSQTLTKELQRAIYDMQRQIILQNGQIQESVNKFFSSHERINTLITGTENELRILHDSGALKSTLQSGVREAGQYLAQSVSGQLSSLSEQMTRFRQSADSLNENIKSHSEQTKNLNSSLSSRLMELGTILRSIRFPQGFFSKLVDKIFG